MYRYNFMRILASVL